MTNADTVSSLRALADYIEKHDVPRLFSAGRDALDACDMHGRGDMATFLRWADTLDGVGLSAMPNGETYHLHARGNLPGTRFPADATVIVQGDEAAALAEEIGRDGDDIPVSRDVLAKIAEVAS